MLPKSIPNLNQILFKGKSSFEFKRPNAKKIPDIDKDQNLKSFCLSKGHKAIIKKTIEKTIPKFLFVGSFIFDCINYFTIFSSKSKAFISSFHSLLDKPDDSMLVFFPEIKSFKTFLPFEDTSVPPTL